MANSLLDFVMSLVRDPDAAARYAADPAQAIADAQLTDVTSTDVNNLIPVVSESLSATGANPGLGEFGAADPGGNVWASGAATEAFDAFGDHVPLEPPNDAWAATAGQVIDQSGSVDQLVSSGSAIDDIGPLNQPLDELSLQLNDTVIEDVPNVDAEPASDWGNPVIDDQHHTDGAGGFDIFD
ncbi:Rv0340 family IniB-related protein [Mycolicibacterium sp. HK-90]|uniref:Rv0340 family IniB-related protein n=1 Tax=Mycolicibacterium sp. HK-90 TaxID=3056937 RepID=UPI00265A6024|nr:Rv0340 family IniB-related protein [Mycolicibacterium sp. HK-90]WKG04218.1 Rv0340 family protein [Mycolicibacterium sp. HK-90]